MFKRRIGRLRSSSGKLILIYTLSVSVVVFCILGLTFYVSEVISMRKIQDDLIKDVEYYADYIQKGIGDGELLDQFSFYTDDARLSFWYDGEVLYGQEPHRMPEGIPFLADRIQTVHEGEAEWFLYDKKILYKGKTYWLRGVASFSAVSQIVSVLFRILPIVLPALIGFMGLTGYWILKRNLDAIKKITDSVNEIRTGNDLSERLSLPHSKDEFYELSLAFNNMFDRIEKSFEEEKQFTSDASHELRTPVAAILARCEYCLQEGNLSEEMEEEVRKIYQKTNQMSRMIARLLLLSRMERDGFLPVKEEVNLNFLCESIVEELESQADKVNQEIIFRAEREYLLETDMGMLTQILMNLLENAIFYGKSENGKIRLEICDRKQWILITVRDEGIGIGEEDLGMIWNRFYRGENGRYIKNGNGLGLSIVKKMTELLGGKIDVVSRLGEGTVFYLQLPW